MFPFIMYDIDSASTNTMFTPQELSSEFWAGNLKIRSAFGRPRHRWKNCIETDVRYLMYDIVRVIRVVQNRD
jgi:hypothetical protein